MTPDSPAKTILVVEDEPDMSIFLSNLLSANGFCPICAGSLTEGLKKAVDGCPDLVIINAMLPGEAGIRLYQQPSDQPPAVPYSGDHVVHAGQQHLLPLPGGQTVATGHQLPEPEAYLQKPPEADELLSVVNRLCATP